MKFYRYIGIAILSAATVLWLGFGQKAMASDYSSSDLMDDPVFNNVGSMTEAQIQSFLNGAGGPYTALSGPSTCLANFKDANFYIDGSGNVHYGTDGTWNTAWGPAQVSAAQIIYQAAQAWQMNPEVILAMLQDQESLVSGGGAYGCASSSSASYQSAMGYDCPTGGGCSSQYAGFMRQVLWGSWQLEFNMQRSEGNLSWEGDGNLMYSSYMTAGTYQRCDNSTSCPATAFSGTYNIQNSSGSGATTSVHIDNGATAALYAYTPYLDQGFPSIYEGWFGPTIGIDTNAVTMRVITAPDTTPAVGETVTYEVSFTNNLNSPLTVEAVGIVGRLGSITGGANRDFGWQGPVTLQPGVAQDYTFTETIGDAGTTYAWPAIEYNGGFLFYNNWGTMMNAHLPKLTVTVPLTSTVTSPVAGQTATLSATVRNDESHPITVAKIGIPVRYYGKYNYDTGWTTSPTTIQPESTQSVSGSVTFDKAGPYATWLSAYIGNNFDTLSPALSLPTAALSPNFTLNYTTTPDTTPAVGQTVTVAYTLTNNEPVPITVDAVGVVGRYDSPFGGSNHDLGWQGPVTFAAGQTQSFSFSKPISALDKYYMWPSVDYQGGFIQYNNWGFGLVPHVPNLTITSPLTINGGSPPTLGSSTPVTVTITNNEPNPIAYTALGIPIRYYGKYNYDTGWQGPGTLGASGQSGDSITLSGTVDFDKHGPYTIWNSIYTEGGFYTLGSPITIQL